MGHRAGLDGAPRASQTEHTLSFPSVSERWPEVKQILAEALEADAESRKALLDEVSSRDPDLAREVRSLLGWYRESADPLTPPTAGRGLRLAAGHRLGPYEIEELLDSGGMGEVYRARDTRLARAVALKVLATNGREDAETTRRFEREARTVASLSHPNILSIFDYGRHEDLTYAVTELLLGENLRSRLRANPPSLLEAMGLARQITNGLAAAHAEGIVHRDLKPENVFLCTDGTAKILDFGLAKKTWPLATLGPGGTTPTLETRAGLILGTVGYMAPEQVRGQAVDARADVFAFGVMLHEMLIGRRPFDRDTPAETLAAVLRDDLPPYDPARVPPPLAQLLTRCMAKDREMRFASAQEILRGIDELESGGLEPASGRWTRRAAIAAVATVAVATLRSAAVPAAMRKRPVDLVIPVGQRPADLIFAGGSVWVANRESNNLTRIEASDGRVTGTFSVGDWPIALAWDGNFVWVSNHKWLPGEYSTVMKVDPSDGRVVGTYRVPGQPMYIVADASFLWVAETWPTYMLRKLRLSDGGEVAAFTAGGAPRQAATDGESVWVANGPIQSVTKMRASDGKVLVALSLPGSPTALLRVGRDLWVNNNRSEAAEVAMIRISADELKVTATYAAVGSLAQTVSERWFFIGESRRIVQRRTRDGSVVAIWAGGPTPSAMTFDGANLWTSDSETNSVSMISGQRLADADRG